MVFTDRTLSVKILAPNQCRLCALPCDEERPSLPPTNPEGSSTQHNSEEVTNRNLKEMCDSILLLLATSVEAMEPVLWPHLMDYLLSPDFGPAIPSIVKSLGREKAQRSLVISKEA